MTKSNHLSAFLVSVCFVSTHLLAAGALDPSHLKPAPVRPSSEAEVVSEEVAVVDTCEWDKICVEGQLYSSGAKTANGVKLRVEIGGTKHSKPRFVFYSDVENPVMNPGDRQDFALTIDRKIPYKQRGEEKVLEVGKYNFKIVPVWAKSPTLKMKSAKPPPKKTKK